MGSTIYVMGGVGLNTVEKFNLGEATGEEKVASSSSNSSDPVKAVADWTEGPRMPVVVARGCAVTVDEDTIMIVGNSA